MTATLTVRGFSCSIAVPGTQVPIDWADLRQTMEGFGASDSNEGDDGESYYDDATADLCFDPTVGLGLTLYRIQIAWNPIYEIVEHHNSLKAHARGCKLWCAPWSAQESWKTTGPGTPPPFKAGYLLTGRYDDWANYMITAQSVLQSYGISEGLYAMSIQNEPDWPPGNNPADTSGYPVMRYTYQNLVDFAKVFGPKLATLTPQPKLLAGEFSGWDHVHPFVTALNADPTAAGLVDIVAVHEYFGNDGPITGWPLWQTEVSELGGVWNPSMADGLSWAKKIHGAVADSNCTAWHYWTLKNLSFQDDNASLVRNNNEVAKRGWALAHYARYARPGMRRIPASAVPSNVYISAYRDTTTGAFSIICINDSSSSATLNLSVTGATPTGSVVPHRTSASEDMATLTTVTPVGSSIPVTLAANSITTFTGTAS